MGDDDDDDADDDTITIFIIITIFITIINNPEFNPKMRKLKIAGNLGYFYVSG